MTLHLLKQSAKPCKPRETRKKYPALEYGKFQEEEKEDEDGEVPDKEMGDESYRDVTNSLRKSKRNRGAANISTV